MLSGGCGCVQRQNKSGIGRRKRRKSTQGGGGSNSKRHRNGCLDAIPQERNRTEQGTLRDLWFLFPPLFLLLWLGFQRSKLQRLCQVQRSKLTMSTNGGGGSIEASARRRGQSRKGGGGGIWVEVEKRGSDQLRLCNLSFISTRLTRQQNYLSVGTDGGGYTNGVPINM